MGSSDEQIQLSQYFDYDSLDQAHRLIIQQHTGEIRKRLRRSAQDVWEIGQRLADVRSRLKYGQFLAWLKAEFGWSQRTAYNFINVYETFGDRFAKLAKVDIATSVLYQLAAPSVPEELRTQVLKSAAEGEKVTQKQLKSAIKQYKQPDTEVKQPQREVRPVETPDTSPKKPEIITIIPRSAQRVKSSEEGQPALSISINPGWYGLDTGHKVFCGDTASESFVELIPPVKLAVAVTNQDWAHDWLVEQADSVVILPEEDFTIQTLEQLLNLLSSSGDRVLFPWLPLPRMIAIAHHLGRKIYAGDPSPMRCQLAIASSGLKPDPITGSLMAKVG